MDREETQVSRALIWMPWYFLNRFIESTRACEEILGRPPTTIEIFYQVSNTYGRVVNNMYEVGAILYSLLREDLIYADEHCYTYTCVKKEGYYSYSDFFQMKFGSGYICDKRGHVVPSTARVLNLK